VFCLNSAERSYLVANRWAEPERVAVLPNGVERAVFVKDRDYRPQARRLVFMGQWLRAKGTRYLTEAFAAIATRHPGAELTCLGTGADTPTVLADFGETVRPRVRVVPSLDRGGVAHELARADLFLFPSLSEGFSGALIEAMAAALPIVTTPVGAAPDLLQDGHNAMVVSTADAPALAAAACALLDDPERRQRMGMAGQAVASQYEWDLVNQSFTDELLRAARFA
jgi:glycosyltransferase involved in cell wall biosynthesis